MEYIRPKEKGNSVKIYDVIIAGASFAGLSVASKLKGKVLLIDMADIGKKQISACGAPLDVIEGVGCKDSVLQVSNIFSLHVNRREVEFNLKNPYCTFDYFRFCSQLYSGTNAEFLKAAVIRIEKNGLFVVHTSGGKFTSEILVDATGWRAFIAEKLKPGYVHRNMLSFGIETEVPYREENFHFFYEPEFLKNGVGWIFPCGEFSRFGVASYRGERKLLNRLDVFLERYRIRRRKVHGGFFCYSLKEPVIDNVFIVGCAQGQTLPLTGEGIRRCIKYGVKCGEIIRRILEGEITMDEGLEKYSRSALEPKVKYSWLLRLQNLILKVPERNLEIGARIVSHRFLSGFLERRYLGI